jgi:hypothetical protein
MINNNKPLIVYSSAAFSNSGYGRFSLDIAKILLRYCKKKDWNLKLAVHSWGSCSSRDVNEISADPESLELMQLILRENLTKKPDVWFQVSLPCDYRPNGNVNIGASAFIETSQAPGNFLECMNNFDLNIVMSEFNKEVAIKTEYIKKEPNGSQSPLKLNRPIETLMWGQDDKLFANIEPVSSIDEELAKIPETFAFFYSGMWGGNMNSDRKNTGKLIETFLKTFAGIDNPPCLILKTNGPLIGIPDRSACIEKLNEITNMVKNQLGGNVKLPQIYLLYGMLNEKEMTYLHSCEKVKVFVSLSFGESWAASTMASTFALKPTIVPAWSGPLDYMNKEYADFFDGKLIEVHPEATNDWILKGSQWFEVDYAKASEKMKDYFFNYTQERIDKAIKLGMENREKFNLKKMEDRLFELLDKYIPPIARASAIVLPKLRKITLPTLRPIESNNQQSTK